MRCTIDFSTIDDFVNQEIENYDNIVFNIDKYMKSHVEEEDSFLEWVDFPNKCSTDDVEYINRMALKIQTQSDILIVIGIGGSYLGSKAAIEVLKPFEAFSKDASKTKVLFVGQNLSSVYLKKLLHSLKEVDISINVISKSGTTTEPAIAFRIFKEFLIEKYGKEEANNRIYITTDPESGALKQFARKEGLDTFDIPRNIGGRYSVLTAVGLLPMAVAGINIKEVLQGAKDAFLDFSSPQLLNNFAYQYAVARHLLYMDGKTIECLVGYEPYFHSLAEWWKQLFGESEGKDGKGLFPASLIYPTDLHSLGQYIQEGPRNMFQTILYIENEQDDIIIPNDAKNLDNLNYLSGTSLNEVKDKVFEAALLAHEQGGVPNLVIRIPEMKPYYFGYLVYFFQKSCAMSGYLLGVNPFDQPGVEAYKKNMFQLLGKPGYEKVSFNK